MIKNIIFDFDGVILDSVSVKTEAFRKLFDSYPKELVAKLIEYHLENGGISRFVKIKYFFEILLKQEINDKDIQKYTNIYSELTKEELSNPKYIIEETINFIKQNYKKYNMHIASGADENDLRYICNALEIEKYFLSIYGSPKKKSDIVKDILVQNDYQKNETILIGDSVNDYEAAKSNCVEFYGYNNILLSSHKYLINIKELIYVE